jgi:multiple sugar transport system permease protein
MNSEFKQKLFGKIKKNMIGWVLILPTILAFILFVWRPIIIGVGYSFFDLKGFKIQEFVGLKNYVTILTDTNFLRTLWNTISYVLWSLVLGLPLPFFVAVMLNEMRFGKQYFKISTYLPCVLPGMAVYLLWTMIYGESSTGLINSFLNVLGLENMQFLSDGNLVIMYIVLMMTWQSFGSTTIMYLATLQGVDQSLYEAARLDGAGLWQRFKNVTFPHCRGIILLLAVKQIIGVFSITEQPMVMTGGGPNGASLSLGLTNYYYAFKYNQMQNSLALGVVTFVFLVGLTVVYFHLDKKINE